MAFRVTTSQLYRDVVTRENQIRLFIDSILYPSGIGNYSLLTIDYQVLIIETRYLTFT